MLNLNVPYGHVAALTVASFFLSWAWYSPLLFGKPFMKALGIPEKHEMTEEDKKRMPMLMANGLFCSFAVNWALQVLILSTNTLDWAGGAALGAICWIGFAVTGGLNTLWEKRPTTLIWIGAGLGFVLYAGFGAILAAWR
jgi:hypothetical protein